MHESVLCLFLVNYLIRQQTFIVVYKRLSTLSFCIYTGSTVPNDFQLMQPSLCSPAYPLQGLLLAGRLLCLDLPAKLHFTSCILMDSCRRSRFPYANPFNFFYSLTSTLHLPLDFIYFESFSYPKSLGFVLLM